MPLKLYKYQINIQQLIILTYLLLYVDSISDCYLQNCLACSQPYQCTQCIEGLSCCQSSCSNCQQQNKCLSCVDGYALNSTLSICQLNNSCLQPACSECTNSTCNQCVNGFVFNQWTLQCKKCPNYCWKCTLSGQCFQCYNYYGLNKLGQCQYCGITNCKTCSSNFICIKCSVGYYRSSAYCSSCPENCLYCQGGGSCELCDTGYYLVNYEKCKPCASICNTCFGSANNCTACNSNSFLLNNSCINCFTVIPFCVQCLVINGEVSCLNCSESSYLQSNVCKHCGEGCLTCNSENCTNCFNFYYLSNSSVCQPCIINCNTCTSPFTCSSCSVYFYLSSNQTSCLPCSQNCGVCDQINCVICSPNFISMNNICVLCPPNCDKCQPNECVICEIQFYLMQPQNVCIPCPLYCYQCNNAYSCVVCFPGTYRNEYSLCIPILISNCYINQTGNNSLCSICNNRYYLSQSAEECLPCIVGCSVCSNSNQCTLCSEGYSINNQSVCLKCLQNCVLCSSSSNCLVCSTGFYTTVNSSCNNCPSFCSACTSAVNCLSCDPGYYLNSNQTSTEYGLCLKCTSPCLMCSGPSTCLNCLSNFTLVFPGVCAECPPNCLKCVEGRCVECSPKFALILSNDSTLCSPCPENCVDCQSGINSIFNQTVTKCISCSFGLTLLLTGECFPCGSNNSTVGCQQCSNEGQCTKCYSEFQLVNGQCINGNFSAQKDWRLLGTLIGLGCLAVLLFSNFVIQLSTVVLCQISHEEGSAFQHKN